MIGLVLSGGQSSRMGQDKGLMMTNGVPWAKLAIEKLNTLGNPTLLSVNEKQFEEYEKHFNGTQLVVDRADLGIQGPLAGVLTDHTLYPDQDILVLACDMILLRSFILEKLLNEYQPPAEAVAFKGESVEPLCAIYSAQGLKKIDAQRLSNTLAKHSMLNVLEVLNTTYLPLPIEWQPFFRSFNRPDDLNK